MPESDGGAPRSNRENDRIVLSYIALLLTSGDLDKADAAEWVIRWWEGSLLLQ